MVNLIISDARLLSHGWMSSLPEEGSTSSHLPAEIHPGKKADLHAEPNLQNSYKALVKFCINLHCILRLYA